MKVEIEVELAEHVAAEYEVVRIGTPTAEDVVIVYGRATKFDGRYHDAGPRLILRRKENPRDWWPPLIIADKMTFEQSGMVKLWNGGIKYFYIRDDMVHVDVSWIPSHLKRSGRTIENPWKAKVQ